MWTLYRTSQKIQNYFFFLFCSFRLNTSVRNHWNLVYVIILFTMYNVHPWTRGKYGYFSSSVSNDTAPWIKWPCLFCRTVFTPMNQHKLLFNRNVHFSGGNTLIFCLISFPRRAHILGVQNTSSISSEAGGDTCSVVNSNCISSLPTQPTNGLAAPSVLLSALVQGQPPSLAVPGTLAPLARRHHSDSTGTPAGKHQTNLPNCFTTKYIHLVGVLPPDQF